MRRLCVALVILLGCVLTGAYTVGSSQAATAPTIRFVNNTGHQIWVGSTVLQDGSTPLVGLPKLASGESKEVTLPGSKAGHWRGTFFARHGCVGESGSTFSCTVGDCGNVADRCVTGEQPVSLAEFNFDKKDSPAPWYDVSYVNAVSVPISIAPVGAPPRGATCDTAGCERPLLKACPSANLKRDSAGRPMLCVNPNRDAVTPYSNAIGKLCPKAYTWSKHDTVPGNQTMYNCPDCKGFVITFGKP